MKIVLKAIFIIFSLIFLLYLALPAPRMPSLPKGVVESKDAGDHETPLRRAFYTNMTRQEVLSFYQSKFENSPFYSIPLPTYRLNYPPEEAQNLVRDQTLSTFLEEIVHPFRETFFVNGFEPKDKEDKFQVDGKSWNLKITIKYVPSSYGLRIGLALATVALIYLLGKEWGNA